MSQSETPGATSEIAALITSLYNAYGDRPSFDAHLDPQVTIWESDSPTMLRGLEALDDLRDERSTRTGPPVKSLETELLRVEAWDTTGIACYRLRARLADDSFAEQSFRVTDVVRRDGTGWRIVHHHSEVNPA